MRLTTLILCFGLDDKEKDLSDLENFPKLINLSTTQRAVAANEIANMRQGERTDIEPSANLPKVISQPKAAKKLSVSERSIRSVKAIERKAPKLLQKMKDGDNQYTSGSANWPTLISQPKAELANQAIYK